VGLPNGFTFQNGDSQGERESLASESHADLVADCGLGEVLVSSMRPLLVDTANEANSPVPPIPQDLALNPST